MLSASNDSILDYIARKVRTTKVTLADKSPVVLLVTRIWQPDVPKASIGNLANVCHKWLGWVSILTLPGSLVHFRGWSGEFSERRMPVDPRIHQASEARLLGLCPRQTSSLSMSRRSDAM